MQLRFSFSLAIVAWLCGGCGDSTASPASAGGASPGAVTSGAGGADGGGASTASSGAGTSGGVIGASLGGANVSPGGAGGTAAGQPPSGGQGGAVTSLGGGGGGGAASSAGSTSGASPSGGSPSDVGAGVQTSGVPVGWIPVDDVDYSKVPGPNFETVRLMLEAASCSGSNCHFGGRNHFQAGKSADELYRYMMSFTTLKCGKLIDTANPSESAFVKYLRGPCGGVERMPYFKCFDDGDEWCVPEYYIKDIEAWIAAGAPR